MLARDAERLPAGYQDAYIGAGFQHLPGECGAVLEQMFAVVEHKQCLFRCEMARDRAGEILVGNLPNVEDGCRELRHEDRFGQRGEVDPPGTVNETTCQVPRHPEGEASLATSTCPRERDEPVAREQRPDGGCLPAAPDEAGGLQR